MKLKKFFYILLCLVLFAGCDNIVLRKDKSERVTFDTRIPQGDYTLYMYEISYPEKQEEKLMFFSKFENFLRNGSEGLERDVTFILSKPLYDDVKAVLNDEGIGIERAFFKSASFIDENDKEIIDRETNFVRTPSNGGEIQRYLNKQYYYILSLVGRQSEYKDNFFYTEFDKRTITAEYLNERESLKEILAEKKKDFVVKVENVSEIENYPEDMVYLDINNEEAQENSRDFEENILNENISVKSPAVIINSNDYKGYTVRNNTLIFFNETGEGRKEELNYFRRYNFTTEIKEIDSFNYSNFVVDKDQVEISVLLGRKKYVPKRPLK